MRFMAPPSPTRSPAWLVAPLLGLMGCAKAPMAPDPVAPAEARREEAPGGDLVYFVMVDRFANGDPSNDAAIDPSDPHAFHGGDLRGVLERVDYLAELGVTHVWLSPVFAMRTSKIDRWGAFHGYWVRDLTRVEPRFGTEADLAALSQALHARGMKLVLDMVWNHTDYDAPLLADHPDWFHQTGDIEDWDDPIERITGRVHGLPDLAQEKPVVRDYLAEVSTGWVDRVGADGFRVDAVGHMPLPALAHLNDRLDAHKPGFWTVGEDFSGDPIRLSTTLQDGHFDAVFDFPLRYALVDVFCKGAPLSSLGAILSLDRLYDDPSQLVVFLDNHDVPRFLTECNDDTAALSAALTTLLSLRGTPALTWGTELSLAGGDEPDNRRDQPWERVGTEADLSWRVRQGAGLRADAPVLQSGSVRILEATDSTLHWLQVTETEVASVVLSRDGSATPRRFGPSHGGSTTSTGDWAVTVRLERHAGDGPPPWAEFLAPPPSHRLLIEVEGDPTDLRVVGAGPELGHWDPIRAIPVGEDGLVQVDLPRGTVAAFKLARVRGDTVEWDSGPNTTVHLSWNDTQTRVSLAAP